MEQTEEIIKAIGSANKGSWIPLLTISTSFTLMIALLLVIWKMTQKSNDKRHSNTEKILTGLIESNQTMSLLLVEYTTTQKYQQKEIDSLLKGKP